MTVTSDAIREMIDKAGGVAVVAREAEVKDQTLYTFMSGRTRNLRADTRDQVMAAIARLNNATGDELANLGDDFQAIKIVDLNASAGFGATVNDGDIVGYQPFRVQQLERLTRAPIDSLAVIRVEGDSMEPTLSNGDQILVDTTVTRIGRDAIYVLSVNDDLIVKRCQVDLETRALLVNSDNALYKDMKVTEADMVDVKGRVIWIGRALG